MALLLAGTVTAIEPAGLVRSFPRMQVLLVTAQRCIAIDVWIAADNARRAQGLMYVEAMASHEGMLFVYDRAQVITMWMQNTLIPLDMLFASADGEIMHLHPDAVPHDTSIISSVEPVSLVLELNAGSIAGFGIKEGDRLIIPAG